MDCPHCAEGIPDRSARCPACDERLDDEDAPPGTQGTSAVKVIARVAVVVLFSLTAVSVLGVLLTPALTGSNEKARRTKCANTLRQIGLGGVQYADDTRFFPHIRGRQELDGDVHTSDTPRALRLIVSKGYLDSAEAFICPSSTDRAMPGGKVIADREAWQWGGTEAAHGPLDPLADDPRLDRTDELSFGWVRRSLTCNARSTTLLSADRAVVESSPASDALRGNHLDGWNVGQADGAVQWLGTRSTPFPGGFLAKTEGAGAGSLAVKDQDDPSSLP